MKTHLIVAFMVSTILFSFVDVDEYNSTSLISYNNEFSIEDKCGFSTFSESVKSSFFHASNLNNYESSQIYLTNAWTIVLANPYCNYNFAELISKNSKSQVVIVKNQKELSNFFQKNLTSDEIVIGMGAGLISNWMRELKF